MTQKYKVFIQDTAVYFVSRRNLSDFKIQNSTVVNLEDSEPVLSVYQATQHTGRAQSVIAYHTDIERGWAYFCDAHQLIEAAGGLVKNSGGAILCILRNDRWDLPKGKIEKGESKSEAALREVEEECGIHHLVLEKKLCTTFHTYEMNKRRILKPTYWFSMASEHSDQLIPQVEEGITDVRWISKDALNTILENTYPSLLDVFKFV